MGIAQVAVLVVALALFCLLPPEAWARGPDLCLWRFLFDLSSCPACGSTRALAAFFHGQFARGLAFNGNVLITAPGLLVLLARDSLCFLRSVRRLLLRRAANKKVGRSAAL